MFPSVASSKNVMDKGRRFVEVELEVRATQAAIQATIDQSSKRGYRAIYQASIKINGGLFGIANILLNSFGEAALGDDLLAPQIEGVLESLMSIRDYCSTQAFRESETIPEKLVALTIKVSFDRVIARCYDLIMARNRLTSPTQRKKAVRDEVVRQKYSKRVACQP